MPPRLSRGASDKLDKLLLGALCCNAAIGFGVYLRERSLKSVNDNAAEERLEAAKRRAEVEAVARAPSKP
ncbi:hypothetical protein Rsub_10966 [Raphidocelis subcapitata]|uniref:Uncharacterized protein n=1 Tax=Raphidocelis subcapitata TaxID=307507 RepID=A0A2V0PJY5_9CHLO|nr:hypothetical protein Rsub_10966 [Raphidocelis subcapitata]|eukprot:GBF98303.1 hypothetical protein Rsub_10966 [Raphidocelis subcapitata]